MPADQSDPFQDFLLGEAVAPDSKPAKAAERKVKTGFLRKFIRLAGRLPFADDLAAAYYAALDRDTPAKVKAVLFAALAYFILPTDVIPDIIAGLGFTDDATVLATALSMVGGHIRERHRVQARRLLGPTERRGTD